MLHTIEGATHGLCVVACPKGRCRLAQGNLRAEVRINTIQRLLSEIGLEPRRAALLQAVEGETSQEIERRLHEVVQSLAEFGPSALHDSESSVDVSKQSQGKISDRPTAAAAIA
jgi:coenzyme F420-reducing hydrogenase delta subunit